MPNPKQYTGGIPFHKHLGVSREMYNRMKLAYRQGGFKRSMPYYDGIGDFTKDVRRSGIQVWVCTTRPYMRLDNIDPDTRHWLRRAGMQYDNIIYGPHKYRDLVKIVGEDRVVVVFDDLPKMIEQAVALGLPHCIRAQPYNLGSGIRPMAHNVGDMRYVLDHQYREWKRNHV